MMAGKCLMTKPLTSFDLTRKLNLRGSKVKEEDCSVFGCKELRPLVNASPCGCNYSFLFLFSWIHQHRVAAVFSALLCCGNLHQCVQRLRGWILKVTSSVGMCTTVPISVGFYEIFHKRSRIILATSILFVYRVHLLFQSSDRLSSGVRQPDLQQIFSALARRI